MKNIIILLTAILPFLSACKKEDVYTPNLKGSIVGSAFLFDEFGNLLMDNGGIKISAVGNSTYETTTDYYGRFEFKDIPTGTYTIIAEKNGFGLLKKFGVKHLGGTPTYFSANCEVREVFFLIAKSSIRINSIKITNKAIEVSTNLSNFPLVSVPVRFYYSDKQNVRTDRTNMSDVQYINDGVSGTWVNRLGFIPGTQLYFKAFVEVSVSTNYQLYISGITQYEDPQMQQTIIPQLGYESPEFSFIVPE